MSDERFLELKTQYFEAKTFLRSLKRGKYDYESFLATSIISNIYKNRRDSLK